MTTAAQNTTRWTDPDLVLTQNAASCFLGTPVLTPLSVGTRIYRLRSNQQDQPGNSINESPWWFPHETYQRILGHVARSGLEFRTAARAGLAVPPRFNQDFDTLVICRLLHSGFCWRGPALPQLWGSQGDYRLPGGFEQLWIPGLQPSEFRYEFFGNMVERV
jgi:hypothetical protein